MGGFSVQLSYWLCELGKAPGKLNLATLHVCIVLQGHDLKYLSLSLFLTL